MSERKYSVAEIDRMRYAVRYAHGFMEHTQHIEEELRTYMLNGTEPSELVEFAKGRLAFYEAKGWPMDYPQPT